MRVLELTATKSINFETLKTYIEKQKAAQTEEENQKYKDKISWYYNEIAIITAKIKEAQIELDQAKPEQLELVNYVDYKQGKEKVTYKYEQRDLDGYYDRIEVNLVH